MIWTAARAANSEPRGREGPVQHCFGGALGGKKEGRFGGKIPKKVAAITQNRGLLKRCGETPRK